MDRSEIEQHAAAANDRNHVQELTSSLRACDEADDVDDSDDVEP